MKKYVVLIVLTMVSFGLNAQNYNDVKRVEFEIGGGFITGTKIDGGIPQIGMQLFAETRLNVTGTPFDVGLQASFGYFNRKENMFGYETDVRNRGTLVTFVDYNFRKWKRTALFGGLGIGMSAVNYEYSWIDEETDRRNHDTAFDRSFVVNPRIGVELWNHLRITAEYKLMKREYSYFGLNIGGVFGGGYR